MSAAASPAARSGAPLAYLLLTLAALFWSGNFVLARALHSDIGPFTLAFGRWLIALLLLLPWGLPALRRDFALWWPLRGELLRLGLLSVAGFNSLVYLGLQSTSATNAVLLNSFIPILIALLGVLLFGMRLAPTQLAGVALSFGGVLTIVAHGDWQRLATLSINPGDVWVFCAMLVWAVYTLRLRAIPPQINRVGLLTLFVAIGVAGIAPLFGWEWLAGRRVAFSVNNVLSFAYLGTLPSVAAYYFYNHGVARVGAARAGSFIHLMPAFGALLATLLLGETLHGYHLAGIAAILGGVLLSTRAASRPA